MKKILVSITLFFMVCIVSANVRLPKIFGDNMVLQRDHNIPVWGWADKKEKITVRFNKQIKTVIADKTGRWKINLDPVPAGGPFQLFVTGKNDISIDNILVGDVWVCSGQSNMEFNLQSVNNASRK
ncbi:MAG: hypothetical protein WKI04_17920 [Ferruginibacter sp.]